MPSLPTAAEAGYKDVSEEAWFGMFAPAKTSKAAVTQVAGWFTAAASVPDVKSKLESQGLYPVGICGSEFASFIRSQYDLYGRVIRAANMKTQ